MIAKAASPRPLIMGVVNVTPDSFSDGGRYADARKAVAHGLALAEEGADILDIGGESTRPGADSVSPQEEMDRILPVIGELARKTQARISVDTRKPSVAASAIATGAAIWNDVSALTYAADSVEIAAALDCQIVLMHAQGDPKTMQDAPHYQNVVEEVFAFLVSRIASCEKAGIARSRLIVDPGIGFGKTLAHNLALLAGLERFRALDLPVLVGASRKRFIAAIDRDGVASDRLGGSLAAALAASACGAAIVRVHDVAATRQALAVSAAIASASAIASSHERSGGA